MAVDEPGENCEAGGIDGLGVSRYLSSRTSIGMNDVSILDEHDSFASGLAGGWVQDGVGVDSPNHEAMLVQQKALLRMRSEMGANRVTSGRRMTAGPLAAALNNATTHDSVRSAVRLRSIRNELCRE